MSSHGFAARAQAAADKNAAAAAGNDGKSTSSGATSGQSAQGSGGNAFRGK